MSYNYIRLLLPPPPRPLPPPRPPHPPLPPPRPTDDFPLRPLVPARAS